MRDVEIKVSCCAEPALTVFADERVESVWTVQRLVSEEGDIKARVMREPDEVDRVPNDIRLDCQNCGAEGLVPLEGYTIGESVD